MQLSISSKLPYCKQQQAPTLSRKQLFLLLLKNKNIMSLPKTLEQKWNDYTAL